jgi:dipeptidyl aminopeptidase/acylaminoacyl peptidase
VNRPLAAIGLGLLLAACTGGATSTEQPRQPSARTTSPSTVPRPQITPAPSPSPVAWPDSVVAYPVGSGDGPLPYLEYLPPGYGDGRPRPLLVFLHGVDEHADGSEASLGRILELGVPQMIADGTWPSERPFVVLMPQEPVAKSARCDFGPDVDRFLDFAVDRYEVDDARIYLTGISCGAIGIWDYLASTTDDTVAAAVPISGHPAWAMEKAGCTVARAPIWVFHGARDDTVPVDFVENSIDELRTCINPRPKELELTIYPDADHDAWTRTYDLSAGHDVFAWMSEHSRR